MSTWPDQKEIKEIAKLNGSGVAIIGNRVYEASTYSPHLNSFTRQKYLLLSHYHAGVSLVEAAAKVGMELEAANDFIDSPKAIEWLERQAVKDYARQKWADGGEWLVVGDETLSGKRHLAKDQQVVFQAFGDRFCPKKVSSDSNQPQITINIDPGAVKEAFRRQEFIDAEIVKKAV